MGTDDDLTPEDLAFLGLLSYALRAGAARDCLAGNDTCCFTTEQYKAAYDRQMKGHFLPPEVRWRPGVAEMHLRSIPDVVREVEPGVWAAVEDRPLTRAAT